MAVTGTETALVEAVIQHYQTWAFPPPVVELVEAILKERTDPGAVVALRDAVRARVDAERTLKRAADALHPKLVFGGTGLITKFWEEREAELEEVGGAVSLLVSEPHVPSKG